MSSASAATRWWENYLVRYFLPSVAGMLIIRWLDLNAKETISNYVPIFLLKEWKDFGTAHLITWLLFGSLYCYIASYPILVFHATRVLDFKDRNGTLSGIWVSPYLHAVLFALVAFSAAWFDLLWLTFFGVLFFAGVQLVRLYKVYARRELFGFNQGYEASIAYAYLNKLSKEEVWSKKRALGKMTKATLLKELTQGWSIWLSRTSTCGSMVILHLFSFLSSLSVLFSSLHSNTNQGWWTSLMRPSLS